MVAGVMPVRETVCCHIDTGIGLALTRDRHAPLAPFSAPFPLLLRPLSPATASRRLVASRGVTSPSTPPQTVSVKELLPQALDKKPVHASLGVAIGVLGIFATLALFGDDA